MIIGLFPVSPADLLYNFSSGEASACFSGGLFPSQVRHKPRKSTVLSLRAAVWPKALGARQIPGRQTDRQEKGPRIGNEKDKRPAFSPPSDPRKRS